MSKHLVQNKPFVSPFLRFLASGAFNTAITYVIYLVLIAFVPYSVSYTISYIIGIVLAYLLNRYFVFKEHRGIKSAALLPVVYAAQYCLGMAVLYVWVEVLNLPEKIAPLIAIAITVPCTYLLSRAAFVMKGKT